jgi:allophanate hydrolase subunit 2
MLSGTVQWRAPGLSLIATVANTGQWRRHSSLPHCRTPSQVHYNSNRLGVRLNGPRPTWTRTDGGEGGSHPSNVHDHTYAIGEAAGPGSLACTSS